MQATSCFPFKFTPFQASEGSGIIESALSQDPDEGGVNAVPVRVVSWSSLSVLGDGLSKNNLREGIIFDHHTACTNNL
jgi:hypothetical protein